MQNAQKVSAWVDQRLIRKLQDLRYRLPHTPTTIMVAAAAVECGLDSLGVGLSGHVKAHPEPAGPRRALTLRLSRELYARVLELSRTTPVASTPSAALHFLLWVGVEHLLHEQPNIDSGAVLEVA